MFVVTTHPKVYLHDLITSNAISRLKMAPKVSILMGVYNCEKTLAEAIDSILWQTFRDWELVICDDGSSDNTLSLIKSYARRDSRIRIMANSTNLGLAPTLDRCASIAQGIYYARMDGDDISEPNRLEKLTRTLDQNPDVALVSSWMTCFDEGGPWGEVRTVPRPTSRDFISGTPYCHAPCMMRASAFRKVGGYGNASWVRRVEDYYLWFKFAQAGLAGLNLQEALYRVRDDRCAITRRTFTSRVNDAVVRWRGFGMLRLPLWTRLWCLKPLLTWLVPIPIYNWLRRRRLSKSLPVFAR